MMTDMQQYKSIGYEDYTRVGYVSSIKGLLKPFKSKRQLEILLENLLQAREELKPIHKKLARSAQSSFPVKYFPILFRESKSQSGALFLRWRNHQNNKDGMPVLVNIFENENTSDKAKEIFREMEIDRISLNMQMSILSTMIRQVRDCIKKIEVIDELYTRTSKDRG